MEKYEGIVRQWKWACEPVQGAQQWPNRRQEFFLNSQEDNVLK